MVDEEKVQTCAAQKQTEIFSFWFHETNRNKRETDLVSVCFGSNRNYFLFVSRTPYRWVRLGTARRRFKKVTPRNKFVNVLRATYKYWSSRSKIFLSDPYRLLLYSDQSLPQSNGLCTSIVRGYTYMRQELTYCTLHTSPVCGWPQKRNFPKTFAHRLSKYFISFTIELRYIFCFKRRQDPLRPSNPANFSYIGQQVPEGSSPSD